jgi:hypothetical protein
MVLVLFCYVPSIAYGEEGDVCANTNNIGDEELWNSETHMTERSYRDDFAVYYNLPKDEWDGGWGWAKYNDENGHRWEFCKMMSSGRLLNHSFNDELSYQGAWLDDTIYAGTSFDSDMIDAVSREETSIDIVVRDNNKNLRHITISDNPWYSGQLSNDDERFNVSEHVSTPKDNFKIYGKPFLVDRGSSSFDVVAKGMERHLYHFRWDDTSGWSAEDVTGSAGARPAPYMGSDRYLIEKITYVDKRADSILNVVAIGEYDNVIFFQHSDVGGWTAVDLTQALGSQYKIVDDAILYRRPNGTIDIFGRNNHGHLIHFMKIGASWAAEDIRNVMPDNLRKVEGRPSAISFSTNISNDSIFVFFRSGYRLILLFKIPQGNTYTGWIQMDLSDMNDNMHPIEGNPVVVSLPEQNGYGMHLFVRGLNYNLIHYTAIATMSEDLTFGITGMPGNLRRPGPGIDGDPKVFVTDDNRIDVFGQDYGGSLVHYYWISDYGWNNENISYAHTLTDQLDHRINSVPVVIRRNESSFDVIGSMVIKNNFIAHFASAIGLTVNSWHKNEEYKNWASGSNHDFQYRPGFRGPHTANAHVELVGSDFVAMHCASFEFTTPASRAGVMLHEAEHIIHSPSLHQGSSDYWLYHTIRNSNAILDSDTMNHSPYQLQAEYLCDVNDFADWYLPS